MVDTLFNADEITGTSCWWPISRSRRRVSLLWQLPRRKAKERLAAFLAKSRK